MIIARKHRGGLDESMATVKTFDNLDDMKEWFHDCYGGKIAIGDEVTFDFRTGWNTQYVLTDDRICGMCDLNYQCNPTNLKPTSKWKLKAHRKGANCGGFVCTVMRKNGIDRTFPNTSQLT